MPTQGPGADVAVVLGYALFRSSICSKAPAHGLRLLAIEAPFHLRKDVR